MSHVSLENTRQYLVVRYAQTVQQENTTSTKPSGTSTIVGTVICILKVWLPLDLARQKVVFATQVFFTLLIMNIAIVAKPDITKTRSAIKSARNVQMHRMQTLLTQQLLAYHVLPIVYAWKV